MSQPTEEYPICTNVNVNQNLNYLYQQISNIPYDPTDLKSYFEQIFERMTNAANENYLKNAECLNMYNFYNFLCERLNMIKINIINDKTKIIDIHKIPKNSVVTLKIPAVPGYYHFITAVISDDDNTVDIYQSYGSSRQLYAVTNLPLSDFLKLLQDCIDLVTNKRYDYYNDMLKFKRLGRVLSRIMDVECKALENEVMTHSYDYSIDEVGEETHISNLMKLNYNNNRGLTTQDIALGFSNKKAVDIIKRDYDNFIQSKEGFIINVYTPVPSGGKKPRIRRRGRSRTRKNKTRKNKTRKNKTRKYKK